jgi:hypothetical protein
LESQNDLNYEKLEIDSKFDSSFSPIFQRNIKIKAVLDINYLKINLLKKNS